MNIDPSSLSSQVKAALPQSNLPPVVGNDKEGRSFEDMTSSLQLLDSMANPHEKKDHAFSTGKKIVLLITSPVWVPVLGAVALLAMPFVLVSMTYRSLQNRIKIKPQEHGEKLQNLKNIVKEDRYKDFANPSQVIKLFSIGGTEQHFQKLINSDEAIYKGFESSILRNFNNPKDIDKWKIALESEKYKEMYINTHNPERGSQAIRKLAEKDQLPPLTPKAWDNINQKVSQMIIPKDEAFQKVQQFRAGLEKLVNLLTEPGNPEDIHSQIIDQLSQLLKSPVYQNLKDTDNVTIQFLQHCASVMAIKTP